MVFENIMNLEDKSIFGISNSSKDTKNLGVGNVLNTNKRYIYILEIQG